MGPITSWDKERAGVSHRQHESVLWERNQISNDS